LLSTGMGGGWCAFGYHRKNEGTYQAYSSSVVGDGGSAGGRSPPRARAAAADLPCSPARSLSLAPAWPALRESGRRCLDRDDGTVCLLWQRGNGGEELKARRGTCPRRHVSGRRACMRDVCGGRADQRTYCLARWRCSSLRPCILFSPDL
jgi:hypothetical protein